MTLPTMRCLLQPTSEADTNGLVLCTSPIPTADESNGEHLIRVHACSPCSGELLWPKDFPPPNARELVPCPDMAGTVVTAPAGSPFQPGDEVYARTDYVRPANARDYTVAIGDELAHKPKNLSWVEAAAVPVSAQTAWQILFVHAGIVPSGTDESPAGFADARKAWEGKKILVTAAGGGVGVWVVQLAKLLGIEVIGTCGNRESEALVRSFGAREVLNYRTADFKAWAEERDGVRKVDVVVDCIGRKALQDAWWCVKEGGTVLSIFQPPAPLRPEGCEVQAKDVFFIMSPSSRQLQEITRLIEEGECRPLVDSAWPLEQFHPAFRRLDEGHSRGKIVFDLSLNAMQQKLGLGDGK
ncbi:NAD(P)-binding protein [Aspergillus ambiguus]|uniref:NADP-dependent oxidoreductase n=1 Tax=Aspergillus ambiguus TaxID=176160 RepID=UPI003CCD3905